MPALSAINGDSRNLLPGMPVAGKRHRPELVSVILAGGSVAAAALVTSGAPPQGVVVLQTTGIVDLTDWSRVTGSRHLQVGAWYRLCATPGKLSPAGEGQAIGLAVSATQLSLFISQGGAASEVSLSALESQVKVLSSKVQELILGSDMALLVSAGSLSTQRSDLTLSDANGVSFGLNESGHLTASVKTDYAGTNVAATNASVTLNTAGLSISVAAGGPGGGAGTGFTSTTVAGASVAGTLDGSGLKLAVPAYLTTAQPPGAYLTTAQPPGAYLTTAMASNAGSNFAGTNGSISGGSLTLNTSGLTIALPAYLTTAQPPGAYLTTAMASNASSNFAGTGVTTTAQAGASVAGTLNTAGLKLGIPAYLTTAQPPGAYLTTAALSQDSSKYAGTSTGAANISVTLNTAGISLSVNPPSGSGAGTGFTTTSVAGAVMAGTNDTAGLKLGVPAYLTTAQPPGAYLTTAALSQDSSKYAGVGFTSTSTAGAVVAGTHDTAGLKLALPAYLTTAPIKVSAGTLSANRSDLTFSDSNGISFGLAAGGAITATVRTNYLTTAMASDAGSQFVATSATVGFAGTGFTTTSAAGAVVAGTLGTGGLKLAVPSYLTTAALSQDSSKYAGTSVGATNATVTLNTDGLAISVAAPGGPGGGAYSGNYYELDDLEGFGPMTHITAIDRTPIFVPFHLPCSLTVQSIILQMSRAATGSNAFTIQCGFYSLSSYSTASLINSLQCAFSGSNTGSFSGARYFVLTGLSTSLTPGQYVIGFNFSNAGNSKSADYSLFGGVTASNPVGYVMPGSDQNNTGNTTWGPVPLWGRYTATTNAMPSAVAPSNLIANFSAGSIPLAPWFALRV